MNEKQKVRDLENGQGLQYLLDSAYTIFNNPIYMIDSFCNLIAASDGPLELPAWNELVMTGTFSVDLKVNVASTGLLEQIGALEQLVYVKKSEEHPDYGILTGQILNQTQDFVGELVLYEYYSSFNTETMDAFALLLDKIASEIYDYAYFITLPAQFLDLMVAKLLDKTARTTLTYYSQARIMRDHFDPYLYVAVLDAKRKDLLEHVHQRRLEYFISLLKTSFLSYKSTIHLGHIVMLMSSAHGDPHAASLLGEDYSLFQYNGLYAGISSAFEDIYDFDQYYQQALNTLTQGMETGSGEQVFFSSVS